MNREQLAQLRIDPATKERKGGIWWKIVLGVFLLVIGVGALSISRAGDDSRLTGGSGRKDMASSPPNPSSATDPSRKSAPPGNVGTSGLGTAASPSPSNRVSASVLTASGHIVAHERIELSPRFMGVVSWIGAKKGDPVTKGQIVVRLDDSEYRARLAENDGQLAVARVAMEKAELDLHRTEELVSKKVEMAKNLDDARLAVRSAAAQIEQIQGARKLIETWMEWCVIRSPVNGVVLEKLAKANELVSPQTFGGTRGPSTSLLAVADLDDLQIEVDVSESALVKIALGQKCKVSPDAYPNLQYDGHVEEIAPEANRAKGTLQVKVQVEHPDRHLTPELSAKVDFLPF